MKRIKLTKSFAIAATTCSIALAATACGASNESNASGGSGGSGGGSSSLSGTLSGAGSTAQQSAMQAWVNGFQSANSSTTVNYDAIGSGGGRQQFEAAGVQFAGSDDALPTEEEAAATKACKGKVVEFPVYVSPIAVVYNLSTVKKLQLSPTTVASIFAGKITKWNDPAIKSDNPGVTLPSTTITPVHRSDSSGTTGNFTDFLSQTAPSDWTYSSVEDWPLKSGEAASGTSGVVAAVQKGDGSIGYADLSQSSGLGIASIKVGSSFVAPSASAAATALNDSKAAISSKYPTQLVVTVNRKTTAAGAYPIVLVSYHLDCAKYSSSSMGALVKAFETYVVSARAQQASAQSAGSAPLPTGLAAKDLKLVNGIS